MKKLLVFLVLGAIFTSAVVVSVTVPAEIPHEINYQGMLTDDEDNPLNGSYDILFKIYNHPSSGSMQWSETQTGVSVDNGLFSVALGSVTPILLSFYEVDQYWLDITVEGEHMPSRVNFASVAFAYRAQKSDTALYAISGGSYSHNHDAYYVNVIGPDSIRGSYSSALFRVRNTGAGHGIYVYTYGSSADGIVIDTAGDMGIYITDTGDDAIKIDDGHQRAIEITDITDDGIYLDNIGDDGIYMEDVAGEGIWLNDVEGYGIWINDANSDGIYVNLADNGVYIDSTRSGYDGIYIGYAEDDGVQIGHADDEGIYVVDADGDGLYVSNADNDGLHVGHADRYGLYIYDSDNDGIRVSSADGDGIEAYGTEGNELYGLSSSYTGLRVHSFNDLSTNAGLYVYGFGGISGTWNTKLSGSSGDVPGFMVSSTDVELIASGTGTFVGGKAEISFEPEFQEAVSSEIPVKVVLTAQGAPSGLLYVASKSNQGFSVERLEIPDLAMKSGEISFDWIAIGRQKGYEQRPQVTMGEEESSADLVNREEEMRAEELKHQEELERDAAYRQQMAEKQARKEAERQREEQKEEQSTD